MNHTSHEDRIKIVRKYDLVSSIYSSHSGSDEWCVWGGGACGVLSVVISIRYILVDVLALDWNNFFKTLVVVNVTILNSS